MMGEAKPCLEAGIDDYMAKSVELNRLENMLERWLLKETED